MCNHPEWRRLIPDEKICHAWLKSLNLDRFFSCEYCGFEVYQEEDGRLREATKPEMYFIYAFSELLYNDAETVDGERPPRLYLPKKPCYAPRNSSLTQTKRPCKICGKSVIRHPSQFGKNVYCSSSCRTTDFRARGIYPPEKRTEKQAA